MMNEKSVDILLDIIKDGGQRTRAILYFFFILLVFAAVSYLQDAFDSSEKRFILLSQANLCVHANLHGKDTVRDIDHLDVKCSEIYYKVTNAYRIPVLKDGSYDGVGIDDSWSKELFERWKVAIVEYSENSFTTLPFVGIRTDRNLLLVILNFWFSIILSVLSLSILAEHRTLGSLTSSGGVTFDRKVIFNYHVFTGESPWWNVAWFFVFLPFLMSVNKCFTDLRDLLKADSPFNFNQITALQAISILMLLASAIATYIAAWKLRRTLNTFAQPSPSDDLIRNVSPSIVSPNPA
ncbi:MAG: hypothetical protein ACRYGP_09370 [Janthinobacterium lividum]